MNKTINLKRDNFHNFYEIIGRYHIIIEKNKYIVYNNIVLEFL